MCKQPVDQPVCRGTVWSTAGEGGVDRPVLEGRLLPSVRVVNPPSCFLPQADLCCEGSGSSVELSSLSFLDGPGYGDDNSFSNTEL